MGAGASIPENKIKKIKHILSDHSGNSNNKIKKVLNYKDDYGNTYLHYASSNNDIELARLLIGKGAYVNAKNYAGLTPFDYAAQNHNDVMADLLVDNHAEVTNSSVFPTADTATAVVAHVTTKSSKSPKSLDNYPHATLVAGSRKKKHL